MDLSTGGAALVDVNVIMMNVGTMSAYLVIVGDVVPAFFAAVVGESVSDPLHTTQTAITSIVGSRLL